MIGCRALTDDEVNVVIKTFDSPRDKALFILGVHTGFRISEILSLRVKDVWIDGQATRFVSVERRNTKGSMEGRTLPLHESARQAIGAWMCGVKDVQPCHYLFKSRKGRNRAISYQQAYTILTDAFKANGMDGRVATHSMRKTFAAKIHKAMGNDVFKTQRALGHKSIQATISYLQVDQNEIDVAILNL